MKSYRPDIPRNTLLELLCQHFRIDIDEVTYMEQVQMLYIYHFTQKVIQGDSPGETVTYIPQLGAQLKGRNKRKRLYQLYTWCKMSDMRQSGRYDMKTLKPPTVRVYTHSRD